MTTKEQIIKIIKKHEKSARNKDAKDALRDVRWDIEAEVKEDVDTNG